MLVCVDGKNGLRGSLESLVTHVTAISKDFEFLRQAAHSYNETKTLLFRVFATSAIAILIQFGGAVWCVASLHAKQESIREDLNRVLMHIDRKHEEVSKPTQSK